MEINKIIFNGVNSLDYGLYVSGDKTFNSAEKDYTKVSVPGRSGDLLFFNNRFKNVSVTYNAIVTGDYEENTSRIRNWLLSSTGYCRLEDSYHPDEYRMACFTGPINFDTILLEAGSTELIFDCKPQRWLKSGEQEITITREGSGSTTRTISNPTLFDAKPIIRVYGAGTVSFGDAYSVTVTTAGTSYIDIDCDIQDCYEGITNRNGNVTIASWPVLNPGNNSITVGTGITKISITPRWWKL